MSKTKPQNTEPKNHISVRQNPEIAQELIDIELQEGRISGPHDKKPFDDFHISPIKTVPKKAPKKFRKILNLTYPYDETSINAGISTEDSTVQYADIQDCIEIIQKMPGNCFLVKSDLKSAFRKIPVHPDDYPLLGFKFKGKYFYDRCLSQGASSSCQIFERIATALEWILKNKYGVKHCIHILDDFLMFSIDSDTGKFYLQQWRKLCYDLQWEIAEEKTEGPVQSLVFSGITVDTVLKLASLPLDKLQKYAALVDNASKSRKLTLKEMQQIIGCLQFSVRVVVPGKPFIRRLIDTTIGIQVPFHFVTLNKEAKKDLEMWATFLKYHNGRTFFLRESLTSYDLCMSSDASGFACAAVFKNEWFVIEFTDDWKKFSIEFLELYPIVVAINVFGRQMCNRHVTFFCDNKPVTYIINKQSSPKKDIMVLIRNMVMTCMQYNIVFRCEHLKGCDNDLPDKLSRLQISEALLEKYCMKRDPTKVPEHLLPQNWKGI